MDFFGFGFWIFWIWIWFLDFLDLVLDLVFGFLDFLDLDLDLDSKIQIQIQNPKNFGFRCLDSLRLSPEQPVKRKARKNYQFVKAFDSLSELDAYVTMSTKSGYKIEKNNRPVKCSLCCNSDNHKMEQQYWVCLCGVPSCDLAWKVNKCSNSET